MTKKQNTAYGVIGLFLGIIGGIAGTAFSLGADKQRINGTLNQHTTEISTLKIIDERLEKEVQQELDRFSEIVSIKITQLQNSISHLTNIVSNLHTDLQVLKAIMERMEQQDFKNRSD